MSILKTIKKNRDVQSCIEEEGKDDSISDLNSYDPIGLADQVDLA